MSAKRQSGREKNTSDSVEIRRLYKARQDLLVDGVCAGLAEYLRLRATVIRVAFVVLAFVGFWGGLLYLLGMVIIPRSPADEVITRSALGRGPRRGWLAALGFALIIVGAIVFLSHFGLFQWRFWRVWSLGLHGAWPLFVVVVGWAFVLQSESPDIEPPGDIRRPRGSGLLRSRDDRMIAGVCGGLGRRLGLDAALIRVVWAFLTVLSWGVGAAAYGVLAITIPPEGEQRDTETTEGVIGAPDKIDPVERAGTDSETDRAKP